jgi:ribosomal protein S18 acetylase RimI-like enzyme
MEILIKAPWETRCLGREGFMLNEDWLPVFDAQTLSGEIARARDEHGNIFISARVSKQRHAIIPAIQREGFYFVEQTLDPHLTFEKSDVLKRFNADPISFVPFRYREKNLRVMVMNKNDPVLQSKIMECARESFSDDRFHMDPTCPKELADLRFFNWAKDLIDDPEVEIYIAVFGEDVVGFLAQKQGHIILDGLLPSYTGKGLGKFLWLESLSNMMTHGLEHATTRISANNVAALNLHTRLGFKFKNPASMFHYWG